MKLFLLSGLRRGILLAAFTAFAAGAGAQEQRALVIGIDTYQPPEGVTPDNDGGRVDFQNLDGCKNDAEAIKQLITRYSFQEKNVRELYDRAATRDAILAELNRLLADSKKGDIAFIYYAGHGSQMRNTKSGEKDQRDETMVPSNTWQKGVSDIRDKELALLFNSFVDKGVKLTCIFDCCHSGSVSRGAPNYAALKPRFIAGSNFDVADARKPAPPESRPNSGFLMLAAAQDNEFAQEMYDKDDKPHGAFTIALLQAIQLQSIDVPVTTLFQSIREILKANGKRQEPVLAGTDERRRENLFGVPASKLSDDLVLPASPGENGKVTLRGGYAFGIGVGNELAKVNDPNVRLRVTAVKGMGESEAEVIGGTMAGVEAGSLFRVTNWVSNTGPLLKLYLPQAVAQAEAQQFAAVAAEVRKSPKVSWVSKIEETTPEVSVYYVNGKWMLENVENPGPKELGAFTAANIIGAAQGKSGKVRKLYIELPPTRELAEAVKKQIGSHRNLKVVDNAAAANYLVYGTVSNTGAPAYGLKRVEVDIKDSLESMPLRTNYFPMLPGNKDAAAQITDSLFEYALRLGKIRGWMTLSAPKKASFFPYHLELVNAANGNVVDSTGDRIGDELNLRLVANPDYKNKPIPQKYIYVFAIDREGTMTLLYPAPTAGASENKFPVRGDDGQYPREFVVSEGLTVVPPSGTDNYFCIATESPLDNYALLFNQQGVNDGRTRGTPANPLTDVIDMGNAKARAATPATPANWNLIRLSVKTRYK